MDLLPKNNIKRKIIYLDMDAFYASVEIRDNPALKNKAVLIGGDPKKIGDTGLWQLLIIWPVNMVRIQPCQLLRQLG